MEKTFLCRLSSESPADCKLKKYGTPCECRGGDNVAFCVYRKEKTK